MSAGTGLQGSIISLRAGLEGFGEVMIGLIMSANYAGLVLGPLIAPPLIRNVGYVRTFAAFASIGSAAAISHVLWINPVVWALLRLITGLCLSVMLVVMEGWLNSSATTANRGRVLSTYSVVYLFGMGAGQPLLGILSPATFEIFAVTTILISVCLVPVALMNVTGQPQLQRQAVRVLYTFRKSPLAGLGTIISGAVTGATWGLTPRWAQFAGLSEGQIGLLMLLISLGTVAVQLPLGWLSDRVGRRRAIFWSTGIAAMLASLLAIQPSGSGAISVLMFLFGGFGMPLYSLSIALANDQLTWDEIVPAAGALIVMYGVGSAAGPALGGLAIQRFGPGGLFGFIAVTLVLVALFALIRLVVQPAIAQLDRVAYRTYPRTTAVAYQLLRRPRRKPRRGRDGTGPAPGAPPQPAE